MVIDKCATVQHCVTVLHRKVIFWNNDGAIDTPPTLSYHLLWCRCFSIFLIRHRLGKYLHFSHVKCQQNVFLCFLLSNYFSCRRLVVEILFVTLDDQLQTF